MITVAIFDDDRASVEILCELVKKHLPSESDCSIVRAYSLGDLSDVLSAGTQIDILIADIVMPEGQPSGIEVVQSLFPKVSGTQVIYVSGYLDQAPEVYATDHIYFLLKPVNEEKFADALKKALAGLKRRSPTMLRFKSGRKELLVNVASIAYLSSSLHKTTVHCRNTDYETYTRLDELQNRLPSSFVRCHRSYLVNLAYIRSLTEREAQLHDGTTLPVSRRKSRNVQRSLLAFLSKRQ